MSPDAVIAILRAHEAALRGQGVTRAALFGSTVRGEATDDSDLDILVELDPAAHVDVYGYVGITQYIADLFSLPVDVADRAMLIEPVRRTAEKEALYAF
ncbi:nucleotidyltransferase domain-containing protein [Phenylobacterium sp.]|uniref:nucleotidyltransferase family protein n=1 Tax=Phenylobacterium sp. TaxID=1871053 RepID=UPI00286E6D1F|nr:nucleotidyltransferase domain-containing protein [Phenylobacterium sp.]